MSIMAISKSVFLFFIVLCSLAFVGFSQAQGDAQGSLPQGSLPQGSLPQGSLPQGDLPCMQKLLPCHPYLKGTIPPPAMCCGPMKEIVETDSKCLCELFTNPVLLKSFNITQDEGLGLAKTCTPNADPALCQNGASAPGASAGTTPSSPSTGSAEAAKSTATSISQVGRSLSVAAFLSSVIVSML